MEYEWDNNKNLSNIKKHGISFEMARAIFEGNVFTYIDSKCDYGEVRKISIGELIKDAVIVVTHTERYGRTRIISARPAKRKERAIYYEKLR